MGKYSYKILAIMEKAMDLPQFDTKLLSPTIIGVRKALFYRLFDRLVENGYIRTCEYSRYVITLKGLEFLADNEAKYA